MDSEGMPKSESDSGSKGGRVETSSGSSQEKSQKKAQQRIQEAQTRKDLVEKKRSEAGVQEPISYKEIVHPREYLLALQEGKSTPITAKEREDYSDIVELYGGFSESEVMEMSVEEMTSNLQEVLRQVKIDEPKSEDIAYREGTELRKAEEQIEKIKTENLQSRDEFTLTIDSLEGKISKTGLSGRFEADIDDIMSNVSKGRWFEQLPDPEDHEGKFGDLLSEARKIGNAGYSEKEELKQLSEYFDKTFSKEKVDVITDETSEEVADMEKVLRLRQQYLLEQVQGDIELENELNENQQISYGANSLTKIRNIGIKGGLKKELSQADTEITTLLTPTHGDSGPSMEGLRKLAISDFEQFKDADKDITLGGEEVTIKQQKEIYAILAAEQKNWVHERLEKLPLADLDISQVGGDLNFREFNSGQVDMLPEVAEYARALEFLYQAKYVFEVDGLEGMARRASLMKTAEEVLTRQLDGWDEVVSVIEELNIRDWDQELDGNGSQLPGLQNRFLKLMDIPDFADSQSFELFKSKMEAEFKSLSSQQKELILRAAEGRYIVTWNEDGTVKDMIPKTGDQITIDKTILGLGENIIGKKNASFLVGGFVGYRSQEEIDATRKYLTDRATQYIMDEDERTKSDPNNENNYFREMDDEASKKDARTRGRIAAFAGEWMFWRMKGRSAYLGEQGGIKGQGGGRGENDMFYIQGFQHYATQELKGLGESGRELRILLFGADGRATLNDEYVPGMAGGVNFNLGLLDFYSQYTAVFPGERSNKPLQNAGFVRGYDDFDQTKSGEANSDRIKRIMTEAKAIRDKMRVKKVSVDEIEGIIRDRMSDSDKAFLEQYNNLPIVTLAGKNSREALRRMKEVPLGGNAYEDSPDFFVDDLKGAQVAKEIMTASGSGFMAEPNLPAIIQMALQQEGRKRTWQRAKLIYDMTKVMLLFRNRFNREIKGQPNWNSDEIDSALTTLKIKEVITKKGKKNLEKDIFKEVTPGLEKRLTLGLTNIPFIHKLMWVYSKKVTGPAAITIGVTLWEGLLGFISGLRSTLPGSR